MRTLTETERAAINAAHKVRTPEQWKQLPVVTCVCTQRFYQEHPEQDVCRDCMGDSGFYAEAK